MKLAPVARALDARRGVEHVVVHTGQHYDAVMSGSFFDDLGLAAPPYNLEVGSGTHAQQTAAVLERFEPLCQRLEPDWVLVYGDVNSTVAATLAAVKLRVRVAHVEAGLRSRDRTMPEEHNRLATDHLADLLLAPSRDAVANLVQEGLAPERIAFVGNVMIDSLVRLLPRARALGQPARLGLSPGVFALVTLHRASNVDDRHVFGELCDALADISRNRPVVFPIHPRSRERLDSWGLADRLGDVRLMEPLPYLAMLGLAEAAGVVITDSGGVQEETTFLGVPCLTVRPNTERPITVSEGTNRLVAPTREALAVALADGMPRRGACAIERWDGRAAERIVAVVCDGRRYE